jgi:hypothetical protein
MRYTLFIDIAINIRAAACRSQAKKKRKEQSGMSHPTLRE